MEEFYSNGKDDGVIRSEDFNVTERMLIIPQQEENRQFLLSVDRRAKELARKKFLLFIEYDWQANTIATCTLSNLINILRLNIIGQSSDILNILSEDEDHSQYVNLLGLLKIIPTIRSNNRAEKAGSINCKFIPGPRIEEIIGDNTPREMSGDIEKYKPEEYYLTGDNKRDSAWEKFDKLVRMELSSKYKIMLPHHFDAIAITDCYLESLYRELILRLAASNGEEFSISTNVNDYFEIYAISTMDANGALGVKFTMTPGMYGKKGIKDDFTTENED